MKFWGDRIYLKQLLPEDVSNKYIEWMNNEEIIQFLESRWKSYSLEDLKEYVRIMNKKNDNCIFGIFLKNNNEHIGNIKIGNINQIHRHAEIGLIIGDKNIWGKGYGTESINLATKYAFEEINLNKLFAGIYSNNIASYKAFLKAGYREVGILKKHRFYKGNFIDEILVEKCNL